MSVTCNKHCKEKRQPQSPCIHAEITELYFHGWRENKKEANGRKEAVLDCSHSHANKERFTLSALTVLNSPLNTMQVSTLYYKHSDSH